MAQIGASGFVTQPPALPLTDELPASSQSTLLLQKKKEMAEVQQQLDHKKDEFRQRMQRCQEKEVELAAKQEAIKEQVRKFDKFLKDNDAKRMRANRKALEEVKLREQKETEKQQLVKELGVQQQKKEELQEERERKAVYESFLERLCELTEYFEDIDTVLKRYFTLDAANQDLRTRVEVAQTSSEELTGMLSAFTKSTQTESLVHNSEIAKQQQELDGTRLEIQDQEAGLYRREADNKEGVRQLGEINMAIQNIYSRCRVRGPAPAQEKNKVDELDMLRSLLDAVQQRVTDLQAIHAAGVGRSKEAPARQDDLGASGHPEKGRTKRDEKGSTFMTEATAAPPQSVRAPGASVQASVQASKAPQDVSGNSVGGSQQQPRLS